MKKRMFLMMVGAPGSGKSTFIKNHITNILNKGIITQDDVGIISSDNIIQRLADENNLTYNEGYPRFNKFAMGQIWRDAEEILKTKKLVFWDQTNMSANSRRKKLLMVPDDFTKYAVVFNLPEDVLAFRQEKRSTELKGGKDTAKNIVDRMLKSFEMPTKEEGFDQIIVNPGY